MNEAKRAAVIYARWSPRPLRAGQVVDSLETQLTRCRGYAAAQDFDVLAEKCDEMKSGGRADNRPGLQEALDLVCKHKAVLVCYSLSRLSRNVADACQIVKRIQDCGADIASLHESVDTHTPTGRAFYQIMAVINELERSQTAERTSDAMLRLQESGRLMGRHAPYGFRVAGVDPNPEHKTVRGERQRLMVPDEGEQSVIQRIRETEKMGCSLREVARALTEAKIPCRGAVWSHGTIADILARSA